MTIAETRSVYLQNHFKCSRCGYCCSVGGDMIITLNDVLRIAQYLGISAYPSSRLPVEPVEGTNDQFRLTQTRPCFFMDKCSRECTIYPARPDACHFYPFMLHAKGGCSLDALLICQEARKTLHEYLGPSVES